ncbi:MAG: galactokinase [Acidobacteriota bacterium]
MVDAAGEVGRQFRHRYGQTPRIYRAPGRVNLIGEHTDYNEGFVMPAAVDFATWVGIGPRPDDKVVVYSENFAESRELDLSKGTPAPSRHWSDYVFGVMTLLVQSGHAIRGANLLIWSTVPIGAGLSSSAAIEVAVGLAFLESAGAAIDWVKLARLCQRAENEFVGARCGIMDQFIACHARPDQALLLDCRTLESRLFPLSPDQRLIICNTMVKHELAGGEYNARRAECESSVRYLSGLLPQVRALRDVTLEDLRVHGSGLNPVARRRCRHVISENTRVTQAAEALEQGDVKRFGRLMRESHQSLRDDYQVSCPELDLMVDLAGNLDGVYGSRMTGGGFGGCTVNLVQADRADEFVASVREGYYQETGIRPEIYVCQASAGAERVPDRQ